VEALVARLDNLLTAAHLILDEHFTPTLSCLIVDAVGLDLGFVAPRTIASGRRRSATFAETVRRAYAYRCAMCGFDGALGRTPVALEAAHVQWHSQDGPDDPSNGVCLCELHHALFDLGVIGLTEDRTVTVSPLYVARTPTGRAIDDLAGVQLARASRTSEGRYSQPEKSTSRERLKPCALAIHVRRTSAIALTAERPVVAAIRGSVVGRRR
jgi:putative restriction endonuclease